MHPTDDQFTDIIHAIEAGSPRYRDPHWVLWFAAGTILWLAAAIELAVLAWLVRHS